MAANNPSKHPVSIQVGTVFGRWTTITPVWIDEAAGRAMVRCRCSCQLGTEKTVRASRLLYGGHSLSCGCLARELSHSRKTHGHWTGNHATKTYTVWVAMKARCRCPTSHNYPRYGARGISVCSQWDDFAAFLADMGEAPPGMSLERIDNDGNYEPANCRWASPLEQGRNRSTNRPLTLNGTTLCLIEWAEQLGINAATIAMRKTKGWSDERALTTPVQIQHHPIHKTHNHHVATRQAQHP